MLDAQTTGSAAAHASSCLSPLRPGPAPASPCSTSGSAKAGGTRSAPPQATIAHPIIGDATRKVASTAVLAAHLGLQRLWLHAAELALPHPVTHARFGSLPSLAPEWRQLISAPQASKATNGSGAWPSSHGMIRPTGRSRCASGWPQDRLLWHQQLWLRHLLRAGVQRSSPTSARRWWTRRTLTKRACRHQCRRLHHPAQQLCAARTMEYFASRAMC